MLLGDLLLFYNNYNVYQIVDMFISSKFLSLHQVSLFYIFWFMRWLNVSPGEFTTMFTVIIFVRAYICQVLSRLVVVSMSYIPSYDPIIMYGVRLFTELQTN